MTIIGALSFFRELGEMSPHKRACIDWSAHLPGGRQTGSNPFHPSRAPLAAILPLFPRRFQFPIASPESPADAPASRLLCSKAAAPFSKNSFCQR
jgi:hypothetical protein